MTPKNLKDDDFHALFNTPMRFEDEAVFHDKVMKGLKAKTWFRQGLIALSGIIGGLYALVQFIRVPGWTSAEETKVTQAVVRADAGFEAGLGAGRELMDTAARHLADGLGKSTDYLAVMQSPIFFWVSFSLCMTIIGLYLANVREEAL